MNEDTGQAASAPDEEPTPRAELMIIILTRTFGHLKVDRSLKRGRRSRRGTRRPPGGPP